MISEPFMPEILDRGQAYVDRSIEPRSARDVWRASHCYVIRPCPLVAAIRQAFGGPAPEPVVMLYTRTRLNWLRDAP